MRILFTAVGKNHEPYVKAGVDEFTGRVNKYYKADWSILPTPRNAATLSEGELKKKRG